MTVVASLAIAGTNAFFNDVETASGNTFTTGGIDLKVDSQSHYNGLTCENGVWVNHCDANSGANLLVNGDFETPIVTDPHLWNIYPNGTVGLGWSVAWESTATSYNSVPRPNPALQELHRGVNGWLPQTGDQYAELDSDWDGPSGPMYRRTGANENLPRPTDGGRKKIRITLLLFSSSEHEQQREHVDRPGRRRPGR